MKEKRVLFISSTGGHLNELLQLKPLFDKYDTYLMTEKTPTSKDLDKKYKKVSYLLYGTRHRPLSYLFILFANCWISLYNFLKIRPSVIVTTGTHTAGPMCCLGKIFGSKVVFIETFANIHTKTATGRLVYPMADLFIVQWEELLDVYKDATYGGWIF